MWVFTVGSRYRQTDGQTEGKPIDTSGVNTGMEGILGTQYHCNSQKASMRAEHFLYFNNSRI